ncbi:terminase small subunit [Mucilaginibacter mallensis]|uniref:terminase small subunit n=1 Tax=Mucilaginibacter mallensis TaxID=652787 RepID=UPI0012F86F28|nr:terminase small subunit [Mucilaginibacter mallensis]
MKLKHPKFTVTRLNQLIDDYFIHIQGEYHLEEKSTQTKSTKKATDTKIWDRQPEPATITGLAFFLGFSSRQSFDDYETSGKHAYILKRGQLRIEAEYEKKLHQQPASGAIFALRSMGWNEKPEERSPTDPSSKTLKVKILETGPTPASNEKEVSL